MSDEIIEEPSAKLDKISNLLETEGSYIKVWQDIHHGTLNVSVTPKSVNDGTFDKVMSKVLDYVYLYAEKISSQHTERQNDNPPGGYS